MSGWKGYLVTGAAVIAGLYLYSKTAKYLGVSAGTPASK